MTHQDIAARCNGKQGFGSIKLAKKIAERQRRNRGQPIQAYKCRTCGKYHVGNKQVGS